MPDLPELSSTERIVGTLCGPYLNAGRCVFLDNFYTSPHLASWLLSKNTYICATVKPSRKNFPRELTADPIEKGESIFYKCEEKHVSAVKYRALKNRSNNKPKIVNLINTAYKATLGPTGKKDKDGNDIVKPNCVIHYNHQMGGVDLMDQQLHGFRTVRKTYKWPKKVVIYLIMQGCLSASKLYNFKTRNKMPFLAFMHDVIARLLTSSPRLNRLALREETIHRLTGRHFPTPRSFQDSGKRRKTKMCRVCYARGLRQPSGKPLECITICKTCPSLPGLHADRECLETYHTKMDYSDKAADSDNEY